MEKTKPKEEANKAISLDEKVQAELPRVIKIKPGSSSEKSVKLILPDELADATIDQVIKYAVNEPELTRKNARIADRIKVEMREAYGVTVNDEPAKGSQKLADYLVAKKSQSGLNYKEAEIIVAQDQEGGLKLYM